MSSSRAQLKAAVITRLDAVCEVHKMGHQGAYANRYVFKGENGTTTEILFEKGEKSPANLWVLEKLVPTELTETLASRRSPASQLYQEQGANGKLKYGRHSALEKMPLIGKADLTCFNLGSLEQLDRILDALDAA